MKLCSKKWFFLLGFLVVLAVVAAACGGEEEEEAKAPFKLGVIESATGPGETYGKVAINGKQLAVEEINAAGGVNGRKIELIVEDGKCAAPSAITAYTKLTQVDGVKIILGTSCSGALLGIAPLAERDKVIMFSGLATNPDIKFAGDYIYRTSLSDAFVGIDAGNRIYKDGVRKLATISESTDYAEGVRRETANKFVELGGQIVAEERYASDATDFRSIITKVLAASPDALMLSAQSEFTGGTLQKQLRELGYTGPVYAEVVSVGTTALDIAGEAATGTKGFTTLPDPTNTRMNEMLQRFRAKYGYTTLEWYIGSAYDDVYVAAECLKKTNDDQDVEGFRSCLDGITWSGTIGNFSFDEYGEVIGISNMLVEVLPVAERTTENFGYKVIGPAAQ